MKEPLPAPETEASPPVFGDKGPPIIFLGDWFVESTTDWDPQIPYFSRYYRCYVFALDGQEGNRPAPGMPILQSNLNRLISLVNGLGEPVRIVAHGITAIIAIRLAASLPRKVRAMILISPRLDYSKEHFFSWGSAVPFLFLPVYLLFNDPTGENHRIWQRVSGLARVLSYRMAGRYMKELRRIDPAEDFAQVHCRISIIRGGLSRFRQEESAIELNEELPHSHLFQYSELGYNPHRENPEMINRSMHDFLKKSDRILDRGLEQLRFFFRGLFGR